MLIDEADESPDAELRHARRAHLLADILLEILQGQNMVDTLNGIAVLVEEVVNRAVPAGATAQRESIAGHFRHLAEHIDLTCPHLQLRMQGEPDPDPEPPAGGDKPRRHLH